MQDQVIRFAVIAFSGIIGIAVAQVALGGGLDPIRVLTLGAIMAAVALGTVSLKWALERPAKPKTPPVSRQESIER